MHHRISGGFVLLAFMLWPGFRVQAFNPDLIVGDAYELNYYGFNAAGIAAFSLGTVACNAGAAALDWNGSTNRHPVIAQNMFRLHGNRFEHIGMSWLKHGFFADSSDFCTPVSCDPDPSGMHLGPGCSDTYTAQMNGSPGLMGPRSQVNAHTGEFPFPIIAPPPPLVVGRRLQVHRNDIDPALNVGAGYFVEAHMVAPDDAAAGQDDNNASFRTLAIGGSIFFPTFTLGDDIVRESAAIRAWKMADPTVVETDIRIPGEGLLILAARTQDLGNGRWSYEYALFNMNSDRSAGAFTLPIDPSAVVTNIGFHDVNYHSGEPFDGTDWPADVAGGQITWSTSTYAQNPNANALRWSTLYNFRFEADQPPVSTTVRIDLFKPGALGFVTASTIGPQYPPPDCNDNGIPDECDLDCGSTGGNCDLPACGLAPDIDVNGVPDGCDPDCNANGLPDGFDVSSAGTSSDCNENTVPDDCEVDSDGDASPDECDECPLDAENDADGDGACANVDPCPLDPLDDADEDGICAPEDQCADDPQKVAPGICGCGTADVDADADATFDCFDGCPTDPLKISPGECGCGVSDVDSDADTIADCFDACPGGDDRIDLDHNGAPDCTQAIPAMSEWGLVVLALLLLVFAKIHAWEARSCSANHG